MVQIPEKIDSKYRFVLLASKRAEQLVEGAPAKDDDAEKPTRQGMSEIADDRIEWDYGPAEEPEVASEAVEGEAAAEPQEVTES